MKKDVIPEISEDARAMLPVDPRILVRRAPSRDFVAILERGVTLVFTRVGVETRIGSSTTAPRRGKRPLRLEALILSRLTLNPSPPAPRRLRRSRAHASRRSRRAARTRRREARRCHRSARPARPPRRTRSTAKRRLSRACTTSCTTPSSPAPRRGARDADHPRLPLLATRAPRHERSRVSQPRTTRMPLTTASRPSTRRASLRQVYHICGTQGRIALKRTSPPRFSRPARPRLPSRRPHERVRRALRSRCFPSRELPKSRVDCSMCRDTQTPAIFCRFADASRAPLVRRRRRLAAPDRERALEEPDPPRAVHVTPVHARGGG